MEIKIPLPQYSSANTYPELRAFLKQLELAVHHAQKSIEHAEKDGVEVTKDAYIGYGHPSIDKPLASDVNASIKIGEIGDNMWEELQDIELSISLQ